MRLAHRGFFFGEITLSNERSFLERAGPVADAMAVESFPQKQMAISGPMAMAQHPFEDILPDRS
jgi:hypothetical protein